MNEPLLLEVGEAARMLQVSTEGVRGLVRSGDLRCTARTHRGVRLFHQGDVEALVLARSRRAARLDTMRPRMVKAGIPMGQLRLPIAVRAKVPVEDPQPKDPQMSRKSRYVA